MPAPTASSASLYSNWISINRENRIFGPDEIVNDAVKNTYIIGDILRINGAKQSIRSGTHIEERLRVRNQGNFRSYQPGEKRTSTRIGTLETIKWGWRFYENDFPYTDAEIDLSQGDQLTVFKNFKTSMETELQSEHWEGMDNLIFARPDSSLMEGETIQKGKAYSLPAYLSENITTFLPASTTTGSGPVWSASTLAGLAPGTVEKWRNQQRRYDHTALDNENDGILAQFDLMFMDVKFESPAGYAKYLENDRLNAMKIYTNKDGRAKFMARLRAGNDFTRAGPQDPSYGDPVFLGVPIRHASQLDTELLNESGGVYQEAAYPTGKPRYFFVNWKYMKLIFHSKHFMEDVGPIQGSVDQRDTFTNWKVSWCNLAACSRMRQGIVFPIAA